MATEPFTGLSGELNDSRRLSMKDKLRLRDAVGAVEVMSDHHGRQAVIRELREELGEELDISRFSSPGLDVWEIVSSCIDLGGAHTLLEVLGLVGGQTTAWVSLSRLMDEFFPNFLLRPPDRAVLSLLLQRVPVQAICRAISNGDIENLLTQDLRSDGSQILQYLDQLAGQGLISNDVLWRYLEEVAHLTAEPLYMDFHLAINNAAAVTGGYSVARAICARIGEDPNGGRPAISSDTDSVPETDDTLQSGAIPTSGDLDMNPSALAVTQRVQVPAMMRGLPPRNVYFAGRNQILDAIRNALLSEDTAAVLPHTLHGLGGVGKSQVAIEYAYRYSSHYDLVFLIDARDEQSIRRSFISLGKALNVPETADVEYMIDATLNELRIGRLYPRWLLLFDDSADPAVVGRYLPSETQGPGHILITSRNRGWATLSNVVEVDVFTVAESVEFLRRRWPDLTPAESADLAVSLGNLPLALELAASFHEQTAMPLTEYMTSYRLIDILDETTPTYPVSVAKTWRLTFEQVAVDMPGAAQLLQLCAFISSAQISASMLREGRGADLPSNLKETLQDELTFRKAVAQLGKYALAQIDRRRDFITIHMLLRAVVRDAMDESTREQYERAAHQLIALANPGSPDRSETWLRHAQIAPHVLASGIVRSDDPHVRQVMIDQIRYFFSIGDFAESQRLARQAVEDWNGRLGPDDAMTLRSKFHLGNALRLLGEYQQAREVTQDTLQRLQRTLGAEHENTLQVANSIGADLRLLGEFGQAMTEDEESLERHRRVLGADDPSTLRAANNLAIDYRLLGMFHKARELDEDTVRRHTIADSVNANPETLGSINSLVRDLYGLGEYSLGLRTQLERLPTFETRLADPNHRFLLAARRNLAILWRKTGDYQRALKMAEAETEASRLAAGPFHESTLAAMNTLFNTLRLVGDLSAARMLGEETLAAYRDRFRDHPFTSACAVNLSIVYRAVGRVDEACDLNRQALTTLRRSLGEDHPYTMCSAANESNNLALTGETAAALELSRDIVMRSRRNRPTDHPNTLVCSANLAIDLHDSGEHAEAAALRLEVLGRMRNLLGPEHPETINVERGKRSETDIEMPPL